MRVDDFDFNLPEEAIALEPARPRDHAKLLKVTPSHIDDHHIYDLPNLLREGDLLVVNNTRVLPVQLSGMRAARDQQTGHDIAIDVTLHKKIPSPDHQTLWRAFIRPAKRVRSGDRLVFSTTMHSFDFSAVVKARNGAEAELEFDMPKEQFFNALMKVGAPPLPPYIARKRELTTTDKGDYQTRFAEHDGSVAAPTAGLHFTDRLIKALNAKGVLMESVTLHVGAGTYLPVTVEDTRDHKMHSEWGHVSEQSAQKINEVKKAGGRIIAVGTTALRLLESATHPDGVVEAFHGDTDIFITPGYKFRVVDCMMTNFHLPRSTLFMLVCAFAGTQNMKTAYAHAIENAYRFYSYGDACLLELNQKRD